MLPPTKARPRHTWPWLSFHRSNSNVSGRAEPLVQYCAILQVASVSFHIKGGKHGLLTAANGRVRQQLVSGLSTCTQQRTSAKTQLGGQGKATVLSDGFVAFWLSSSRGLNHSLPAVRRELSLHLLACGQKVCLVRKATIAEGWYKPASRPTPSSWHDNAAGSPPPWKLLRCQHGALSV